MSREFAGNKRKRPDPGKNMLDSDRAVLNAIISKKELGIWKQDIRNETKLNDSVITKAIKTLIGINLIKEVTNVQNKTKKHYMGIDFEPSKAVSGGAWYADGVLDLELIKAVKRLCSKIISNKKAATLNDIHGLLKQSKVIKFELSKEQISDVLNSMILDNEIIEAKSNGLGECHLIPFGSVCYRMASSVGLEKGPKSGGMSVIPCGMCPRINMCTPDGIVSPNTCVYYSKWLSDISF